MVIADAISVLYPCCIHRGKLGKPKWYENFKKKKVEMCGGVSALNCLGPTFCDKV